MNLLQQRKKRDGMALYTILAVLLGTGALIGLTTVSGLSLADREAKETARPANMVVTTIASPSCTDCFPLDSVLASLASQPVNLEEHRTVSFPSDEATGLISTYNIQRLPAIILTGETDKENVRSFLSSIADVRNGAMVWTPPQPVYMDAATGEEIGRVSITVIRDASCSECTDPSNTIAQLERMGVRQESLTMLDWKTSEAQQLIGTYALTAVPALILSSEAGLYPPVVQAWTGFGTTTEDGTFVASMRIPPYTELPGGRIRGNVHLTAITDAACSSCYDVGAHRKILEQNFGVRIADETTADINSASGKQLAAQYGITAVPMILLTGDTKAYPNLVTAWKQIGSIEEDGTLVFRDVGVMGTYYDLRKGTVINPSSDSAPAGS